MKKDFSLQILLIKLAFFLSLLINTINSDLIANEVLSVEEGEQLLGQLKAEKQNFLRKIDIEEDECLKLFISGPCLQNLIIKHDSKIRSFEQQKQKIMRKVRRFQSDLRMKKRERKGMGKETNNISLE